MVRKVVTHVVRERYQTHNGVKLLVESWPREIVNNRMRVTALDYDVIYTTVSLDAVVSEKDAYKNPVLIEGIAELEHEDEHVRESAAAHLESDMRDICNGIGANYFDHSNLLNLIHTTRKKTLSFGELGKKQ